VTAASTAGGTELFPYNPGRLNFAFSVTGEDVRVTTDGSAPSATNGMVVPAGGSIFRDFSGGITTGRVRVWSTGGTAVVDGEELVQFV